MGYLVFDIETVQDKSLLNAAGSEKDLEKAKNGEFLNPIFHRPICFSFMFISKNRPKTYRSYVGDERMVVRKFWDIAGKAVGSRCTFVTFNGKNFDFPVMLMRGLREKDKITMSAIKGYLNNSDKWEKERPNYSHRYTKYHIDLIEVFGGRTMPSLFTACTLYGIPVKTEAHGSDVEGLYENGEYRRIASYCAEDVLATAKLLNVYLSAKIGEIIDF
ncbi:MAG: hypothetical protein GWP10_15530, partial [Nitrospiraceae bacterium]|nr:hypothetical protein [Nitrospiraceae bacterium]